MNSLQQYLDIYKADKTLIDSNSAEVMNALRPASFSTLEGRGFPTLKSPDYERTSVADMMAPDFGLNLNRVDMPVDVTVSFKCNVPNMSTLLAFTVNDLFKPTARLDSRLPEGVRFMSLRRAAAEMPDLVARYYGKIAPADDTLVAFNNLLAQDGVFIYVPAGVTVEKPLQLVNIFSAPVAMMAVRRVLIVLERNARCQLLVCDHTQDTDNAYISSLVTEISLAEGASLDICDIEESSPLTSRVGSTFVDQHESSHFTSTSATLTCGKTRNNMTVNLNGHHAESRLAGMAINSGSNHVDNCTRVNHLAPRCKSDQSFRYVLDDQSTGSFEGTIVVDPSAPFTEAYQSNRNILASTDARMHTKPQLLIYNDDVKCSHGATTGQLDQEALFYMRTRGIPLKEARTMLMQAFMVDIIDSVGIEGLRDRLRHLVEMRFQGAEQFCGRCQATTCSNNPNQ